ncbi:MAG: hypothetical protein WCS17_01375 [Prevotella sp.]
MPRNSKKYSDNIERRNRLLFINYLRAIKELGDTAAFVNKSLLYDRAAYLFSIDGDTAGRIIRRILRMDMDEQKRILNEQEANEILDSLMKANEIK